MNIKTKKECLAICKKMMEGLNGKWKATASGPNKAVVRNTDWTPFISNGEVYILLNTHDGSYSAAFEGDNFEFISWDGRTPASALKKLIKSQEKSIQNMIYRRDELNSEIPKEEEFYERMKTWIS